ncbi:hypothetical protein BDP27DRAFT_1450251 [Rhodocollybia butyracea]|uniref:Uncharacterized protein n=1 Tax=Rhodocollybia butyracea TaxID=206335 RepID=A0A9P5PMR4_9AGAR|nr:hypothetical protein BDP27DRAFT_1450251 [Rhodocollybia butyracea]
MRAYVQRIEDIMKRKSKTVPQLLVQFTRLAPLVASVLSRLQLALLTHIFINNVLHVLYTSLAGFRPSRSTYFLHHGTYCVVHMLNKNGRRVDVPPQVQNWVEQSITAMGNKMRDVGQAVDVKSPKGPPTTVLPSIMYYYELDGGGSRAFLPDKKRYGYVVLDKKDIVFGAAVDGNEKGFSVVHTHFMIPGHGDEAEKEKEEDMKSHEEKYYRDFLGNFSPVQGWVDGMDKDPRAPEVVHEAATDLRSKHHIPSHYIEPLLLDGSMNPILDHLASPRLQQTHLSHISDYFQIMFFTFFTRHSLAFVLFAVLISPACAAPTLERRDTSQYRVQLLNIYGDPVAIGKPPEAQNHVENWQDRIGNWQKRIRDSIIALGKEMEDPELKPESIHLIEEGRQILPSPFGVQYYKLEGGKFCTGKVKCYGYVAKLRRPLTPHGNTLFGAVVVVIVGENEPRVVHTPLDGSRRDVNMKIRKQKYAEFMGKMRFWKRVTGDPDVFAALFGSNSASPNSKSIHTAPGSNGEGEPSEQEGGRKGGKHTFELAPRPEKKQKTVAEEKPEAPKRRPITLPLRPAGRFENQKNQKTKD